MSTPAFALERPDLTPWRGGNTGTPGVWHFDSGLPGRHVLVSSLVHGNELCGAWAVMGLLEREIRPARGTLTLVFANLAAFDRFDPATHEAARFVDEDLNRQWVDERMAEAGTRERTRAAELASWVRQSDWLLDLHSMSMPSPPLMLAGTQPRHLELARQLGAPEHVVVDAGHRDGVRMRDYGRFGLPDAQAPETRSLLVECGFHGDPDSRGVAEDACVRFLQASGVVAPEALDHALSAWRQPDAPQQWVLEVGGAVTARSRDFRFTRDFQGLECIAEAGTVIGFNEGEEVTTPHDDCVLVMPSARQARAGVTVVRFARRRRLT